MPLITGTSGNDTLIGTDGVDEILGLAGDDIIQPGSGADVVNGGDGDDTLIVTSVTIGWPSPPQTTFEGGAGYDSFDLSSFTIGPQAYWYYDTASGAISVADYRMLSVERLFGSAGRDVFNFPQVNFNLEIHGGAGNDHLSSGSGSDRLYGGDGDDLISDQFGGENYFYGGAGNDTFEGTAEVIDGGAGIDTYVARYGSGVVIDLADARFVSVENISVSGPAYYDVTGRGDGAANTMISTPWIVDGQSTTVTFEGRGGDDILVGAGAADTLLGGAGDDLLEGGGGNDLLDGGGDDDLLRSGAGVDVLNGGGGIDTVDYSSAAAGMRAQLNTNASTNDGDGGTDTFSGIENLTGSAFNDILIGDGAVNVLRGGLGSDTLIGLGGNDVLWGGAGAGNTLQGGLGDDTYVLESADSITEFVGEGTDTVDARINTYVLATNVENLVFGGNGNFAGTGNASANVITGGDGNDALRGRGGIDTLNGGLGTDTADYTLAAARVVVRIDLRRATNDGDGATDFYASIENAIGSAYNDVMYGDGNANVLMGGVGQDVLVGGGGDDILMGGSGGMNNQLQGGTGDDWYILEAFDTCVEFLGEGVDTVEAKVGSYTLGSNVENLMYTGPGKFVGQGNTLDNVITGGALNDILRGLGGNDTIRGGSGVDEVQLRGTKAQYTVTAEGAGWRVIDSIAGRDGSTYVESVEVLRFLTGNTSTVLAYPTPAPGALESSSEEIESREILPGLAHDKSWGDAFVLPAMPDDQPLVLGADDAFKFAEEPQVLPRAEASLAFLGLEARLTHADGWLQTTDQGLLPEPGRGDYWIG